MLKQRGDVEEVILVLIIVVIFVIAGSVLLLRKFSDTRPDIIKKPKRSLKKSEIVEPSQKTQKINNQKRVEQVIKEFKDKKEIKDKINSEKPISSVVGGIPEPELEILDPFTNQPISGEIVKGEIDTAQNNTVLIRLRVKGSTQNPKINGRENINKYDQGDYIIYVYRIPMNSFYENEKKGSGQKGVTNEVTEFDQFSNFITVSYGIFSDVGIVRKEKRFKIKILDK